jgi:serine/threonine-protein kinase
MAKEVEVGDVPGLTASGTMLGTPHFMSPEQLLDPRHVDHRSDLWSLGVVAYWALLGRPPFDGDTLAKLFLAITNAPLALPSQFLRGVPPAVDAWFGTALSRDREARFGTAAELGASLRSIIDRIDHAAASRGGSAVVDQDGTELGEATTMRQRRSQAPRDAPDDALERHTRAQRVARRKAKMLPYPHALAADLGISEEDLGIESPAGRQPVEPDSPAVPHAASGQAGPGRSARRVRLLRAGIVAAALLLLLGWLGRSACRAQPPSQPGPGPSTPAPSGSASG